MRPAAAASALAGCTSHRVPLSKSNEDAAKVAILKQARNPDSVQFGEMTAGQVGDNMTTVCARVNGMNGLGGVTGYQVVAVRFYGDRDPMVIWEDGALECAIAGAGVPKDSVSAELLKKHHIGEDQAK